MPIASAKIVAAPISIHLENVRFSFNVIVFALDEWRFTEPQLMRLELIEQLNGKEKLASLKNFQSTEFLLPLMMQFSVMISSPLNNGQMELRNC